MEDRDDRDVTGQAPGDQDTTGPDLGPGMDAFVGAGASIVGDAVSLCEVPAPTFMEAARAALARARGRALGLGEGVVDAVGNVVWELPGDPSLATLVVTAHLDTVFGPEVLPRVRREGCVLAGPGIGDNSLGVAAMLHLASALAHHRERRGTVVAAANVCEEGLGNLRGMWALWKRYSRRPAAWLVIEGGTYGEAEAAGIASLRYRISARAPGGHSWTDFGRPSAIHGIAHLVASLGTLDLPGVPRTTYNVGEIGGGISVNTIAASAWCLLDLRSETAEGLADIDARVRSLAQASAAASGVAFDLSVVGERPAGSLPPGHWLVRAVDTASVRSGAGVTWKSGSTDANVPLSQGAPAVCLGVARGRGLHTLEEEVDTAEIDVALEVVFRTAVAILTRPANSV